MALRLTDEESGVAMSIDPLLAGKIHGIGRTSTGRLSRMSLDQHTAIVKTHKLAVCTRPQTAANKLAGQRVERLGDLRVLIAGDLGPAPQRHVVDHGGSRQQRRLFDLLEVFARETLRASVTTQPIFLKAPAQGMLARLLDGDQVFASKAIIPDVPDAALDSGLIARLPDAGGVDLKPALLAILPKHLDDLRLQRVGCLDDRLGVVRDQHMEHAAIKLPRGFARGDRGGGCFPIDGIHETVAGYHRGEDEALQPPPLAALVRLKTAHPARIDLEFLARITIEHSDGRRLPPETQFLPGKAVQRPIRDLDSLPTQQLADLGQAHPRSGQKLLDPRAMLLTLRPTLATGPWRTPGQGLHHQGKPLFRQVLGPAAMPKAVRLGGLQVTPHGLDVQPDESGDHLLLAA